MVSFIDSIGSKIDVSLSITVAKKISSSFSGFDDLDVLKASVMIVWLLTFLESCMISSLPTILSSVVPKATLSTALVTVRRIFVVIMFQLILNLVQPKMSDKLGETILMDLRKSDFRNSEIPLSIWPVVEAFAVSSLTIIVVSFVFRMITIKSMENFSMLPEIQRVIFSIQYTFADTVSGLFIDGKSKLLASFVGAIFISPLAKLSSQNDEKVKNKYSSITMWIGGVSMAWMNMVVQVVVPSLKWSNYSGPIDVATALSLAVFLQALQSFVPGLESLQGYLEWNLANTAITLSISASGEDEGKGYLSAVAISAVLYAITSFTSSLFHSNSSSSNSNVKSIHTILDVSTLVIINGSASLIMRSVGEAASHGSIIDRIVIFLIVIVMGRCFIGIYSSKLRH